MAVEMARACGYRRIGGIYLEGEKGPGWECGVLPLPVRPCRLCGQVLKFTRALQKIQPSFILSPGSLDACTRPEQLCERCPLGNISQSRTAGFRWIGNRFYTPYTFTAEARLMGVSLRLPSVPRWITPGETWIMLGHRLACPEPCTCDHFTPLGGPDGNCQACHGSGRVGSPGVFYIFRARRLVMIVSDALNETERAKLAKRGLDLVEVPEDDPDHQPGDADKWKDPRQRTMDLSDQHEGG